MCNPLWQPLPSFCQTLLLCFHSFGLVLRLLQDWNRSCSRGWWECKLLPPLWKTICPSPVELNICMLYDLAFCFLVCASEISLDVFTRIHVKEYVESPQLDTVQISIIWDQLSELGYSCTMGYYTEKKVNESHSHRPAMNESYKDKTERKSRLLETS